MEQAAASWPPETFRNGANVAKFAARGGPVGSKNLRKSFMPSWPTLAAADEEVRASVDALRCLRGSWVTMVLPAESMLNELRAAVPAKHVEGVKSSLAYVRDRVGVPRDPLLAGCRSIISGAPELGIDSLPKIRISLELPVTYSQCTYYRRLV
jgi:hypothetical protein